MWDWDFSVSPQNLQYGSGTSQCGPGTSHCHLRTSQPESGISQYGSGTPVSPLNLPSMGLGPPGCRFVTSQCNPWIYQYETGNPSDMGLGPQTTGPHPLLRPLPPNLPPWLSFVVTGLLPGCRGDRVTPMGAPPCPHGVPTPTSVPQSPKGPMGALHVLMVSPSHPWVPPMSPRHTGVTWVPSHVPVLSPTHPRVPWVPSISPRCPQSPKGPMSVPHVPTVSLSNPGAPRVPPMSPCCPPVTQGSHGCPPWCPTYPYGRGRGGGEWWEPSSAQA